MDGTRERRDRFSRIFWNYHFKSKENIGILLSYNIFEVWKLPRTIMFSLESLIQKHCHISHVQEKYPHTTGDVHLRQGRNSRVFSCQLSIA